VCSKKLVYNTMIRGPTPRLFFSRVFWSTRAAQAGLESLRNNCRDVSCRAVLCNIGCNAVPSNQAQAGTRGRERQREKSLGWIGPVGWPHGFRSSGCARVEVAGHHPPRSTSTGAKAAVLSCCRAGRLCCDDASSNLGNTLWRDLRRQKGTLGGEREGGHLGKQLPNLDVARPRARP
jgi:hypothetical protein